jgi:hypothetical protein
MEVFVILVQAQDIQLKAEVGQSTEEMEQTKQENA